MSALRLVSRCLFCLSLVLAFAFFGLSFGAEMRPQSMASVKASSPAGHIWFIRADGGDRRQCTGKTDATYPKRGTMQPCAFRHPYYLFTNDEYSNKAWVVEGG